MEDHQKNNMFYHLLKETLQDGSITQNVYRVHGAKHVGGIWCIYIIHQLNKGLDLNTAIHQELYGTGEDLYQNDRDIEMWFIYNYARVILSKNGMRRMAPPDFLFKHRIQTCKCHNYSHHLSKKYPKFNML